jgi:hypothetical protein
MCAQHGRDRVWEGSMKPKSRVDGQVMEFVFQRQCQTPEFT